MNRKHAYIVNELWIWAVRVFYLAIIIFLSMGVYYNIVYN